MNLLRPLGLGLLLYYSIALGMRRNEGLEVKVTKHYQKGEIIVLNRGSEDAIVRGDHVRIFQDDLFIGRGLAIKAMSEKSLWLVYYTQRPSLIFSGGLKQIKWLQRDVVPHSIWKKAARVEQSFRAWPMAGKRPVK